MSILEWNESHSVGIAEIDGQHKALFGLLRLLTDEVGARHPLEEISQRLDLLIDSAEKHFRTEERYMMEKEFPGYENHKREHEILTYAILCLKERLSEGKMEISADMLVFLGDWLELHMLKSDKSDFLQLTSMPQ